MPMTCSLPFVHDKSASMISKITHHGIPRTRPHHDDEDALSVHFERSRAFNLMHIQEYCKIEGCFP